MQPVHDSCLPLIIGHRSARELFGEPRCAAVVWANTGPSRTLVRTAIARLVPKTHNKTISSNALVFSFMYDGIPVVYYGQEQYFKGRDDPANREPLWPSQYHDNDAVRLIASINQFRNFLVSNALEPIDGNMSHTAADWLHQSSQVLSHTEQEIVLARGPVISVLTGRGSAVSMSWFEERHVSNGH